VERLTSSSEYAEEFESSGHSGGKGTLRRLKNYEGTSNLHNYDSKAFGSLDSLRDLVNGSKEDISQRSTDGMCILKLKLLSLSYMNYQLN